MSRYERPSIWSHPVVQRGMYQLGRAAGAYVARRARDRAWEAYQKWGFSPLASQSDASLFSSQNSMSDLGKHLRGSYSAGGSLQQAKKSSKRVNGNSPAASTGVVPAMFQHGRGAEVPGIVSNYQKPLKRRSKPGPSLVDAASLQNKYFKGCKVTENFAFKMIMQPTDYNNGDIQADVHPITRFVVNNVFRHKNSAANDPNPNCAYTTPTGVAPYTQTFQGCNPVIGWTGMRTGQNTSYQFYDTLNGISTVRGCTTDWNYTLGPDKAYVRKLPPAGTAQDTSSSNLDASLVSPFRLPQNGTYMYSTLTMQSLENIGWNLNPFKFKRPQNTSIGAPGTSTAGYNQYEFFKVLQPPLLYQNAPYNVCAFYNGAAITAGTDSRDIDNTDGVQTEFYGHHWCRSYPNLQDPCNGTLTTAQAQPFDSMQTVAPAVVSTQPNSTATTYQSQFGPGSVHYTFANNGNAPVIVDIVVHTVKKGKIVNSFNIPVLNQSNQGVNDPSWQGFGRFQRADSLAISYGCGYVAQQLGQTGGTDLNGRSPKPQDCVFDAKVPFMSASLLKIPNKPTTTAVFGPPNSILFPAGYEYAGHPWKQDMRDQFVVAAGAQRSWTFTLPSMNYFSPDYRQGGGATSIDFTSESGLATGVDNAITSSLVANAGPQMVQPGNDFSIVDDLSYIVTIGCSACPMPVMELNSAWPSGSIVDRSSGGINVSVTGSYTEMPMPVYVKEKRTKWNVNGALTVPSFTDGGVATNRVDILNLGSVTYTPTDAPFVTAEPLSTDPLS